MLISLEWLNEYIDLKDLSSQKIAETLTDLGLEVEGIETLAPLPESLVVGQIIDMHPHPDANSLNICTVDIGNKEEPLTIVCGAPNARKGLHAPVATIGTILPGDFKIKPSKIRGQSSYGMMCSQKELQVSNEDAGLWEISSKHKPGTKISEIIDTSDTIFELSITPNRADCLSYIGIARDLGAKLLRPIKHPKLDYEANDTVKTSQKIKASIGPKAGCGRFTALCVEGVKAVPSPIWMQKRIEKSGIRPINLIVDITNYVLLEYGQPIHAYDERFVSGGMIEVRSAKVQDKLTTLDGQDAILKDGDILICDSEKPIGLAGIMGGLNSEIKEDSSAIIIEVAHFSPTQIRRTSKRLGYHTDASHRFERGINIDILPNIAKRVGNLLFSLSQELGLPSPKISNDLIDIYPEPKNKTRIALRLSRAKQILGLPKLTIPACCDHLDALGFDLLDKNDDRMVFEAPFWRHDIIREIDLIEEIARLEGYNNIPYSMPVMEITPSREMPFLHFAENAKVAMASLGMSEIITFPFVSENESKKLGISIDHPLYPSLKLSNPISEEYDFLQTTLLLGLLNAVSTNRKQGQKGSRLFEIGRGYFDFSAKSFDKVKYEKFSQYTRPSEHFSTKAREEKNRPTERQLIAGIIDFPLVAGNWLRQEQNPDFFTIKELIYAFLKSIGINSKKITLERPDVTAFPFFHPGASATLTFGGDILGWMGELHPRVAVGFGFHSQQIPIIFELDLNQLFSASMEKLTINTQSSKYPPVNRDIALLVEKSISHKDFDKSFNSFKKRKFMKNYKLFDVYEGDKIAADKRSFAYTLSFQSMDKTLTDKEVDKEMQFLLEWLNEAIGATQR